jgi:HK97 family phage prohead protease
MGADRMSALLPHELGSSRPPKDGYRGLREAKLQLREASGSETGAEGSTLAGYFAVFDTPTEIDSNYEGHFIESIAPGAFKKTFQENRANMRVLLNHGAENDLGSKPIGKVRSLREDAHGAAYEVDLFRGIPELVLDGLRSGQYGSSFRFKVIQEDFDTDPPRSAHNPHRIPERVLREARVYEFGPTPFPAYPAASAGLRSLSDRYLEQALAPRRKKVELPRRPVVAADEHPWWELGREDELVAARLRPAWELEREDEEIPYWWLEREEPSWKLQRRERTAK